MSENLGMDGREISGVIFDIERASLHDGPGIRTTVFLKGCPLRCLWCHNPEASSSRPQLYFNAEKCATCGDCVSACPNSVHSIRDGVHFIVYDRCQACGKCVLACTHEALKIIGERRTVAEVLDEVLADRPFFEQSGGGLTLSGGEPMLQFQFSLALLQSAKNEGLHTCLETSGFASRDNFETILPFVDLVLLDFKISAGDEHRSYTGVSNELIFSNIDFLYSQDKPIVLRCPIIPGINDNPAHFAAIADLSAKYPNLAGIELLPYHDMGNGKRAGIGVPLTLAGLKATPADTAAGWVEQIHLMGCEKAQIG